VGVVCLRDDEVLLIRRAKPPRAGEWSLPGGHIEFGEPVAVAALRELHEETGVRGRIIGLIEVVDAITAGPPAGHFLLVDFAVEWLDGEPMTGDDALEAAFVPLDRLAEFELWSETRRIIEAGVRLRDTTPPGGR
jgi:8-oxo-dGTP diphosphatase